MLGLTIGWHGGSRAYGTGLHTLFRDHLGAFILATGVAVVAGALAGSRARTVRDVLAFALGVVVGDIVAGLLVAAGVGELTFWDMPSILFVETVAGTQLMAAGLGVVAGYVLHRPDEPEISARR